jgi:nitric oxide dioxygenase
MLSQKTIDTIISTVPVLEVKGTEITTVFYRNLFSTHPELLNIFNHANQQRGRQQTALANTILAAAVYIDRLEAIIPAVKQIAHKHRSLGVKPEHYPIVGEHLLGAIKEVLGDAATDEIIGAWADAYGVIADAFIGIEKEMYEEAASQPAGWDDFKEFTVTDKVMESDVITSFYLKPTDGSAVPAFLPGQYITIRIGIPGEEYLLNRQYSLSAAPGKDYFRISVKREAEENSPEGKVSNFLHEVVEKGSMIEVTAPAGDFTLTADANEPVVFLSGGVGITPFMSMIGAISEQNPGRKVEFIHASRSGNHQPFKKELSGLEEKLENSKLRFVYEKAQEADRQDARFAKEGYIDIEFLSEILADGADYYVCGPVPFLRAVVNGLKELNVEESKIHFEFFGPAMNLEE